MSVPASAAIGGQAVPTAGRRHIDAALSDDFVDLEEPVTTTAAVTRKPALAGRLALGGLLLAAAAGGSFAVKTALDTPAGPQSPEEAVDQFFAALDREDFIGVGEVLLPTERESVVEPTLRTLGQLQRLEIIDPAFQPEAATEFDIVVDGITYTVETVGPRLANVTTTGGTIAVGDTTVGALPLGSYFDSIEMDRGEVLEGDRDDLGVNPATISVVEHEGSWYVSAWYSLAEARRPSDRPFPGVGAGPAPVGGATPEAALEAVISNLVEMDPRGVLTMLDPAEAAGLYDYSPLYLPDLESAAADARTYLSEFLTWQVDGIEVDAWELNGRTVALPTSMAMSGTLSQNGETSDWAFEVSGDCVSATYDGVTEETCATSGDEEVQAGLENIGVSPEGQELFDRLSNLRTGPTMVERDGRWYLSVVPSVLNLYTDLLGQMEPEDLDTIQSEMVNLFEGGLLDEALGEFGGPSFAPIGGPSEAELQFESVVEALEMDETFDGTGQPALPMPAPEAGVDTGTVQGLQDFGSFAGLTVGEPSNVFVLSAEFSFLADVLVDPAVVKDAEAISLSYSELTLEIVRVPGGLDESQIQSFESDAALSQQLGVSVYKVYGDSDLMAIVGEYVVTQPFYGGTPDALFSSQVLTLRDAG